LKINYFAGLAAEHSVARAYVQRGYVISQERWRGSAGEIDLIAAKGDALVFIEVKKSKSIDRAVARLGVRQQFRIRNTASEYLAFADLGMDTDARFDVALVDSLGQVHIIENAFGQV